MIGYVPQDIFMLDDSIINNIAFGIPSDSIDIKKVKTAAEMANLLPLSKLNSLADTTLLLAKMEFYYQAGSGNG